MSRWARFGCFGCAGLVLVLAVLLALFVVPEWLGGREVSLVSYVRDHAVPTDAAGPGRIELDVSGARVELRPSATPGTIRLEANHDPERFALVESLETPDGGAWTYRVRFARKPHFGFFGMSHGENRLTLYVPRGTPLALAGAIAVGGSSIDAGGLALVALDLELGAGVHAIAFDEPGTGTLEHFVVRGSGGSLTVTGLGNASPARVEVRHSLGRLDLDLRGAWHGDATIDVACKAGEFDVRLPDNVELDIVRGGDTLPLPPAAPRGSETRPMLRLAFDTTLCRAVPAGS